MGKPSSYGLLRCCFHYDFTENQETNLHPIVLLMGEIRDNDMENFEHLYLIFHFLIPIETCERITEQEWKKTEVRAYLEIQLFSDTFKLLNYYLQIIHYYLQAILFLFTNHLRYS